MAVPSDPTVATICTAGMIAGGQYTVTAGSTAELAFEAAQFQEIKTELWAACKTDKMLETQACVVASIYTSLLSLPTDYDSEIRLLLFDADTAYRGTAQAGASGTITLAADFSADATNIQGRYIFTTGGTGSAQFRQISLYNDTTKVATVTAAWTTTPDSTTTYLVQQTFTELPRHDYEVGNYPNARPRWYSKVGTSIYVYPAPDLVYPILLEYRANMTRLDEVGTLLVKHLRERRALWIQGVKTKTMARYDDERYPLELQVWNAMKSNYAGDNSVYERAERYR